MAAHGAAPSNQSSLPILLGVMSNPMNARMRTQWREWAQLFSERESGVKVRFVLGSSFYGTQQAATPREMLRGEAEKFRDLVYVDGREKLPHVGKVTEKSASWWLTAAREHPGHSFYCKCDDDTLVHVDRLRHVLREVEASRGAGAPVYFGHIKWRGWDVGHRFQACGGGWGPAGKTGDDIAKGGALPGGRSYPPCPHAAGPYPYMSGGMVCMSQALARVMGADAAFNDFYEVAKARNTNGVPCKRPLECASQPVETHMWHHEDAGVGFNVFRALVSANATGSIVPVPGHFNDPGIIERTPSAQDSYWSSRAVFVHGIKGQKQYDKAKERWTLRRPDAHFGLRCFKCSAGGTNGHNGDWRWARLPCQGAWAGRGAKPAGGDVDFCPVEPTDHFTCCGWPWVVPELRDIIVSTLRESAGSGPMAPAELYTALEAEVKRRRRAEPNKKCVRDCLNLRLPGALSFGGVLNELGERGDLTVERGAGKAPVSVRLAHP